MFTRDGCIFGSLFDTYTQKSWIRIKFKKNQILCALFVKNDVYLRR